MAEKKFPEGVKEYELKEGSHNWTDTYTDPDRPERKVAAPGDMVPLTFQQYNAFRDRFIDPDAKKQPKSSNPAQAKAVEEDAKIAKDQNALHTAKDFQDPTQPVPLSMATVVGVTETSVGKDADGTPKSAGQVTADVSQARAAELKEKGLLDDPKGTERKAAEAPSGKTGQEPPKK